MGYGETHHPPRLGRPALTPSPVIPALSRGPASSYVTRFACFDWSGANTAHPRGIALAIAERDGPPAFIDRRWSREDVLAWLTDVADRHEPMLIGLDLSPGLPFADAGSYFPGWSRSPADAKALWRLVDEISAATPHLGAAGFLAEVQAARHFRHQHGSGDLHPGGRGRLRVCEQALLAAGLSPSSCFNLIGAAQVGKSSLTGMRVLHRLAGRIPVWPFDPLPDSGPAIVEIYTTIAARAAGVRNGRSKVRDAPSLRATLAKLGAPGEVALARHDDHNTDAIITAAWLRASANRAELWSPTRLTKEVAVTEGWTFGVP